MGSIEEYQQHSIDPITIEKLASSLSGSKVLTPSSSGYDDRVKRWSELSERQAVGIRYPQWSDGC